jgi:hypothetical protein
MYCLFYKTRVTFCIVLAKFFCFLFKTTFVNLNNTFLVNTEDNIGGTFSASGATVTVTAPLAVGDVLQIQPNTFSLLQILNANLPGMSANFGGSVDVCRYSCSVYTGSPQDSSVLANAGSVQRNVNQSRLYGTTTSLNINPVLTPGQSLRINNQEVVLSDPAQWVSNVSWPINSLVQDSGLIYQAIRPVPVGITLNDVYYWKQSNWMTVLVNDINVSGIANVTASTGASGTTSFGLLTLSVKNVLAADPTNRLTVLPGLIGNMFYVLGFNTYPYTQTITSPAPSIDANFGMSDSSKKKARPMSVVRFNNKCLHRIKVSIKLS